MTHPDYLARRFVERSRRARFERWFDRSVIGFVALCAVLAAVLFAVLVVGWGMVIYGVLSSASP